MSSRRSAALSISRLARQFPLVARLASVGLSQLVGKEAFGVDMVLTYRASKHLQNCSLEMDRTHTHMQRADTHHELPDPVSIPYITLSIKESLE